MHRSHPIQRTLLLRVTLALAVGACSGAPQPALAKGKHGESGAPAPEHLSATQVQQARTLYDRTCAGCHGQKMEGVIGPSLVGVGSRYSLAKIEKIAQRGKGKKKSVSMPAGLVSPDEAHLLARWLAAGPGLTTGLPASGR